MDTVKCNMSVLCCLRISDISSSLSTTELSVQPPPPPQPQHRLHHRQPGQQQVQCVGLRGPQPLRAEMVWRVTSRSSRHHLDKFPRRRRCWHRVMRSNKLYKPDSLTSYRLCWANWGRMLILHIPPNLPSLQPDSNYKFWWNVLRRISVSQIGKWGVLACLLSEILAQTPCWYQWWSILANVGGNFSVKVFVTFRHLLVPWQVLCSAGYLQCCDKKWEWQH